jgi:hypothetical protein
MRPDMFHLLVERPRLRIPRRNGSHYPRGRLHNRFERDLEEAPSKLGMKFPHATKWLNENLAPLCRWLRSQTGRPWPKVYGEIRSVVDARSAVKKHILEHLEQFVAEHVEMVNGYPHHLRWGKRVALFQRGMQVQLWVHPRTGILHEAPRQRRKPPRPR